MSFNIPINQVDPTAPTPQNTPLTHAPIAQGLSRPTVPDIAEDNEPDEEEASGTIQQAMLGLVHGKLSGLVGKSSGYVESLPVEVKKNVEALKGVQVKQVELQNQYKRECLELEKKVCHSSQVPFSSCACAAGDCLRRDCGHDLVILGGSGIAQHEAVKGYRRWYPLIWEEKGILHILNRTRVQLAISSPFSTKAAV